MTTAFAAPRGQHNQPIGFMQIGCVWSAAIVAAACAGSHRPDAIRPESAACVLIPPPQFPAESITVALSSALVSKDPSQWHSAAQGAGTAQSYETLPDVECRGRLYPQLVRISSSQVLANASPRVRVRSIEPSTARDVLDAGVDVLVSDDPAIVSYAAHNDELLTLALPWDRTYVVLASESAPADVSALLRLTLAELFTGAVRADTRIAERPLWWESSNHCMAPAGTRPVAPARQSSRVVYRSGDRVAEDIAERLVALAGNRSWSGQDSVLGTLLPRLSRVGARATAAAFSPSAFAAALHAGGDLAYVAPLPRFSFAPCHEVAMLLRAAPWLQSVIPLIDTRSITIVRRGRVGLSVDADGSLRVLDGASGKNGKP